MIEDSLTTCLNTEHAPTEYAYNTPGTHHPPTLPPDPTPPTLNNLILKPPTSKAETEAYATPRLYGCDG